MRECSASQRAPLVQTAGLSAIFVSLAPTLRAPPLQHNAKAQGAASSEEGGSAPDAANAAGEVGGLPSVAPPLAAWEADFDRARLAGVVIATPPSPYAADDAAAAAAGRLWDTPSAPSSGGWSAAAVAVEAIDLSPLSPLSGGDADAEEEGGGWLLPDGGGGGEEGEEGEALAGGHRPHTPYIPSKARAWVWVLVVGGEGEGKSGEGLH